MRNIDAEFVEYGKQQNIPTKQNKTITQTLKLSLNLTLTLTPDRKHNTVPITNLLNVINCTILLRSKI